MKNCNECVYEVDYCWFCAPEECDDFIQQKDISTINQKEYNKLVVENTQLKQNLKRAINDNKIVTDENEKLKNMRYGKLSSYDKLKILIEHCSDINKVIYCEGGVSFSDGDSINVDGKKRITWNDELGFCDISLVFDSTGRYENFSMNCGCEYKNDSDT